MNLIERETIDVVSKDGVEGPGMRGLEEGAQNGQTDFLGCNV